MTLHITGDPDADALLAENPFALLTGMLLDQQVPMELAFSGPAKLVERLDDFSPAAIASLDPEVLTAAFRISPAVHRFPGSMATRLHALSTALVTDWNGDARSVWTRDDPDGAEILRRLLALPGFGEQKAKIFIAILGKQFGLTASGWREASGPYGQAGSHRSVADIVDSESLALVREAKKAAKAAPK